MKNYFTIVSAFLVLFSIRCTKTTSPEETSISLEKESTLLKKVTEEAIPINTVSKETITNTNLQSFFLSYDTNILKTFRYTIEGPLSSHAAEDNVQYMINKNVELINILTSLNSSSYTGMSSDDELVAIAGLFELYFQLETASNQVYRQGFPWQCIRTVLEGLVTGAGIVNSYKTLVAEGASWATVRSFLWQSLKRYGGWIMAAGAIYDIITECF